MILKTMAARTLFGVAALSALAASANAFVLGFDPQIVINRTIDSPTITVRYTGASAALVELRINGSSFGTRSVTSAKDAGETNFTLSEGDLHSGDNDVEIRLFDRTGKLIAKDHANFQSAAAETGPVFLASPKTGDTVRGPIEVKLGFDKELKDAYVSFFVDGAYRSMSNVPPFVYVWDTERETNGWHELEGWAIDETSTTNKTTKIRVFVNNPGGNTRRLGLPAKPDLEPSTNGTPIYLPSSGKSAHKAVLGHSVKFTRSAGDIKPLPPTAPTIGPAEIVTSPVKAKPMRTASDSIVMGPRNLFPSGTRMAKAKPSTVTIATPRPVAKVAEKVAAPTVTLSNADAHSVISIVRHNEKPQQQVAMTRRHVQIGSVISHVATAASLVKISKGSRLNLPNLANFEIALDSEFVDFHGVLPRVDDGVPMTPLRFLLEKKGGLVDWDNPSKTVFAKADGNDLSIHIGSRFALVNRGNIKMEKASYLDRGRTVVPVSFFENALHVRIDYDKSSNHMLITSQQK